MSQQNTSFTDIQNKAWFHAFPKAWHPYLYLMRLDRPIGTWLLLWPCWFSYALTFTDQNITFKTLLPFLYFALGAFIMRSCGCVINDLWDRKLDKKVERTAKRPLACGDISIKQALITVFVLLMIGLSILLQFNHFTIILGGLGIIPVILYPLAKRVTYWPQFVLGLTFNWGALLGWSTYYEHISVTAIMLYIGCLFWTIGYDTIYAYQDKKDDVKVGIKSTALLFQEKGKLYVGIFYVLALFFMNMAFQSIFIALPFLHMIWQIKQWNINSQASSLRTFKSNIACGGLIFLCALLSLF